jgi:hypothetical protein
MSDLVPRKELNKRAVQGVVATAGGIATLVVVGISGAHWLAGTIIGAVITVVGMALSGSKSERTAGIVTAVVGAAVLISSLPFLRPIFGFLRTVMGIAGAGLIVIGGVSLVRFFSGLRKRM